MEINVNSKDCFSHCRENLIGSSPPRYRHPAPSHDHLSPSCDRLSPSRDHQTRPRETIRTEEDEERPDSPDCSILGRDKQGICVSTIYTLKEKQIKRVFFSTNNDLFTLPDSNSDSDTGCKPNGYIVLCKTFSHCTESYSDCYPNCQLQKFNRKQNQNVYL